MVVTTKMMIGRCDGARERIHLVQRHITVHILLVFTPLYKVNNTVFFLFLMGGSIICREFYWRMAYFILIFLFWRNHSSVVKIGPICNPSSSSYTTCQIHDHDCQGISRPIIWPLDSKRFLKPMKGWTAMGPLAPIKMHTHIFTSSNTTTWLSQLAISTGPLDQVPDLQTSPHHPLTMDLPQLYSP